MRAVSDSTDSSDVYREKYGLVVSGLQPGGAGQTPTVGPEQGGPGGTRDGPLELGQPGDGVSGDLTVALPARHGLAF